MEISNTIPAAYTDNEAYMNIIKRVSVRRYEDTPVTSDQVSAILHAAMSAPDRKSTRLNSSHWS